MEIDLTSRILYVLCFGTEIFPLSLKNSAPSHSIFVYLSFFKMNSFRDNNFETPFKDRCNLTSHFCFTVFHTAVSFGINQNELGLQLKFAWQYYHCFNTPTFHKKNKKKQKKTLK